MKILEKMDPLFGFACHLQLKKGDWRARIVFWPLVTRDWRDAPPGRIHCRSVFEDDGQKCEIRTNPLCEDDEVRNCVRLGGPIPVGVTKKAVALTKSGPTGAWWGGGSVGCTIGRASGKGSGGRQGQAIARRRGMARTGLSASRTYIEDNDSVTMGKNSLEVPVPSVPVKFMKPTAGLLARRGWGGGSKTREELAAAIERERPPCERFIETQVKKRTAMVGRRFQVVGLETANSFVDPAHYPPRVVANSTRRSMSLPMKISARFMTS